VSVSACVSVFVCVRLCLCVCLVCVRTRGSPRNHLLGGVADPVWVGIILGAKLVLAHTPLEVVRVVHMVSII